MLKKGQSPSQSFCCPSSAAQLLWTQPASYAPKDHLAGSEAYMLGLCDLSDAADPGPALIRDPFESMSAAAAAAGDAASGGAADNVAALGTAEDEMSSSSSSGGGYIGGGGSSSNWWWWRRGRW
jgi:hypothetical protein